MNTSIFSGKTLLLIGATTYFIDVAKAARDMGVRTVMVDYNPNAIAKPYADESYDVDTTDREAVLRLAVEKKIDGVFVGWSDANLYTAQYVCEQLGKPFYASTEQLDVAVNKDRFKSMCRESGVLSTKEYAIDDSFSRSDLDLIDYPVIVKPVDNGGTRGISVCECEADLFKAYAKAKQYSRSGKVIVEEFLENEGRTVSVKYLIRDGEAKMLSMGDRYVLDASRGRAMITNAAFYPSFLTERFLSEQDESVRGMLSAYGFKNGQLFMEGIPTETGVKFYEMGFRLSGGITYKITEHMTGVSGMKMLIRFALSGEMCPEEEFLEVDPFMKDGFACSFAVLMNKGVIAELSGVEDVKAMPQVIDFAQYYHAGDSVEESDMGNIGQMFARITVVATTKEELIDSVEEIEASICITGEDGSDMKANCFNIARIQ